MACHALSAGKCSATMRGASSTAGAYSVEAAHAAGAPLALASAMLMSANGCWPALAP